MEAVTWTLTAGNRALSDGAKTASWSGTKSVMEPSKTKNLGKYPLNSWDDLRVQNGKAVWATFDHTTFEIQVNTLDASLNHNVKQLPLP